MVTSYLNTNQSLNYRNCMRDGQFINFSFWLFKFKFPIKLPTIFLRYRFKFCRCKQSNIGRKNVSGQNVFNGISQFVNDKVKLYGVSFFHFAKLAILKEKLLFWRLSLARPPTGCGLAKVGHLKNVSTTFAQMPNRITKVEFIDVSPTIAKPPVQATPTVSPCTL